jgi:hypothetical protein
LIFTKLTTIPEFAICKYSSPQNTPSLLLSFVIL